MQSPSCKKNSFISQARALYIHVPFCASKCQYCGFYSLAGQIDDASRYLSAIRADLDRHKKNLHQPLKSIYIGGGTPTHLPADILYELLDMLKPFVGKKTEFSIEANPTSLDEQCAQHLAMAGVNRVTVGAQSFDHAQLRFLGRGHDSDAIARSIEALRSAGIDNVGCDLIYGIPGQDVKSWIHSLDCALAMGIDHLSCYALSFDENTPLLAMRKEGKIHPVEDEIQEIMYHQAIAQTQKAGLGQYEISNFARPSKQSIHNLTYWLDESYIGIGPSSASYLDGRRKVNHANLDQYLTAIEAGLDPPAQSEYLTGKQRLAETLMLAMRLTAGVDRKKFRQRFGIDPLDAFPKSINLYQSMEFVIVSPSHIRIAEKAMFVADSIFADILGEHLR